MRYDELDLDLIERRAYVAGNLELAKISALASEAEDLQTEVGDLRDALDYIRTRITEANWRTGKKAELRELIETILSELPKTKRAGEQS